MKADKRLKQIIKRREAITQDKWVLADRTDEESDWYDDFDGPMVVTEDSDPGVYTAICTDFWEDDRGVANARFVAHAPEDIDFLLGEIKRREQEVELLKNALIQWEAGFKEVDDELEALKTREARSE